MPEHTYVGGELELFARARHWKGYWCSKVRRYLGSSVLEVGAGMGTNTALLRTERQRRWVCLEPDPQLVSQLETQVSAMPRGPRCEVRTGTISSLGREECFETILYIDVLEHIEDDRGEIQRAAAHLLPGGRLVVLGPAHPWLYSEFDRSIGHYRRYTAPTLAALTGAGLRLLKCFYLDSVGLLASGANRFILGQSLPKPAQIALWDNVMVPCSRFLDPLTCYRLGKTVIAVWAKHA